MNNKRKNNNFKTVKNDKKNNTYAIVLCILIFFWTIASFLGTIAFFRSFDDDDTMVASADTAIPLVDDVPVPAFDTSRDGNFTLTIPQSDVPCRYTYYLEFEDNYPSRIIESNWEETNYYPITENTVFVETYVLYFEFPFVEDGVDYWGDFFEYPLYFDGAYSYINTNTATNGDIEVTGFLLYLYSFADGNNEMGLSFEYRNNDYDVSYDWGYSIDLFIDCYDSENRYYDFVSSYQEGYNAGYTGSQADFDTARQEGYNQGYADGLNKNKYGPFSNMIVSIGFNNLYDEFGDSLVTGWNDVFRSVDIPNALYSIGFDAGKFYYDYVFPTILAEYEDYDYFDDCSLVFDFTGDVFSANTYPFRFYLPSLVSDSILDVRYTDGTRLSYRFVEHTDEGDNRYYTIPFDVSKPIDWFTLTLRGGEDILSSITISVYGQAYQEGYNAGSSVGYNNGFTAGKDIGYEQGYNGGFQVGKNQGFNEGVASANDYTFLGLLTSVVDAPLKVFYDMFDFEILGYNMSSFFLALLSICIVIAVVKVILAR